MQHRRQTDQEEWARDCDLDWDHIAAQLAVRGHAVLPGLLGAEACRALRAGYGDDSRYRSTVVMARHGFGRGEYRYFAYPLPDEVQNAREALFRRLAVIANLWAEQLGQRARYPAEHAQFRDICHAAGQTKPTPLILKYGPGDYNCLHQDLYGERVFPLQVAILLSQPGKDFEGGEFVLTEQRPRMQSRATVVPLKQGDGVVFAVNERPVLGTRGVYRVKMRHGVNEIRSGERFTLGVIFHDAG